MSDSHADLFSNASAYLENNGTKLIKFQADSLSPINMILNYTDVSISSEPELSEPM